MGLGGKLAIAFAVLVAATGLLIGGASYLTTGRQVSDEVDDFLRERANELVDGDRQSPDGRNDRGSRNNNNNNGDGDGDDQEPQGAGGISLAFEPDTEVQLLDEGGEIVSNSGLLLPVTDKDIALADDQEHSAQLRTEVIDGDEYRIITQPWPGGGAVQVARSLDESNDLLAVLQSRLLIIAGIMAAIAAVAGWFLARRITQPLRSLSTAVDAVAETRDTAAPPALAQAAAGADEVGQLARGFDRMLRALDLSRKQQRRLVQDAAHELRTPLTSMKANLDWLSRADDIDDATRADALASVRTELGELNQVITEIIELATDRHKLRPFAPVDLALVAEAAVDRFESRSGRTVELRSDSTIVDGDPDALRRAVTNLLSNADKYSSQGEPVMVETSAGGVWVSDRGEGIPEEDRALVFDRFYRRPADRSQPGSGLGLSIVASIIDAHGGSVEVTEADGGGARVGFRLPTVTPQTS